MNDDETEARAEYGGGVAATIGEAGEEEFKVLPKRGIGDFLKGIGKAAIRSASEPREKFAWRKDKRREPKRAEQQTVPLPSGEPGVRRLRKYKRTGVPASFTACTCKGCYCGRLSRFAMPCHPCLTGRHARSAASKRRRRAYEVERIAAAAQDRNRDPERKFAGNHAVMATGSRRRTR